MSSNRKGTVTSAQISEMGVINNLSTSNFKKGDLPFNVKNDGSSAVVLEVNLWDMKPGVFVSTRFEVGWNPEIVREIKQNGTTALNLKWGC